MLTIEIMGGLGNQLFQIFTVISYSLTNNISYYFENKGISIGIRKIYYWDNIFKSLKSFIKPVINTAIIHESGFHYTPIVLPDSKINNYKLFGYYQSPNYFKHTQEDIFKLINLEEQKKELMINNKNINIDYNNTISLHFRVGDYANKQTHHPLMTADYYIKALKQLVLDTGKNNWNVLYFCEDSDSDINYVNKQINIIKEELLDLTFVKINSSLQDWEQLLTMSLCKHNIIANSTFSWWGAYFNSNPNKKVYYPKLWFGPAMGNLKIVDLFPNDWTVIIV